ncbi:hypothetical protein B5M47_01550 [candidate division CPR3 bacterium 4484_211]|uniref:PPM-type phosphatase domain-containing protein n=1 Tax=candidate division CPR3 bacterium 4484_211 TaxID=1968527 RepID=A0A1W9NYX7_UNCC3|nr:MAG: hypothetical protein B5M47_01550 [candidate division CPR3 bacterium 4484_211]
MDFTVSVTPVSVINLEKPSEEGVCRTFSYRPREQEMHQSRGQLHALITLNSPDKSVDLNLLADQVFTALREEYYQQIEGGIIGALDRALSQAKEKVFLLTRKPGKKASLVELSLCFVVVWGDIFYFGRSGSVEVGLLRGGELVSFPFTTIASEKLKDGDLFILASTSFWEKLTPKGLSEILLNTPQEEWRGQLLKRVRELNGRQLMGALLLSSHVEEIPDEEDLIDIGMLKDAEPRFPWLSCYAKLGQLREVLRQRLPATPRIFVKKPNLTARNRRVLQTVGLSVLLMVTALGTYVYKNYQRQRQEQSNLVNQVENYLQKGQKISDTDPRQAGEYFQEAADLLLEYQEVKGVSISKIPNGQVLSAKIDAALNEAYQVSELGVNKAESWPKQALDRNFVFDKSQGVLSFDGLEVVLPTEEPWQNVVGMDSFQTGYGWNLYLLDVQANQIYKYVALPAGYSKKFDYFGSRVELSEAVDLGIDGSIYVLYRNGQVKKFLGGVPQDFQLSGFHPSLEGASEIFTAPDIEHLYITKRNYIYRFDKSGAYQKGWVLETEDKVWNVFVDDDEKEVWFGSYESPCVAVFPR